MVTSNSDYASDRVVGIATSMQDERRTLISVRDHRCDPRDEIYSLARCNGNGVGEQLASSDKLTASAQTPGNTATAVARSRYNPSRGRRPFVLRSGVLRPFALRLRVTASSRCRAQPSRLAA